VIQLLVPTNYHTTTFAKFKARALQYAIENSTARSEDWIIHLDEETMVTPDAVPHILHHCLREHQLCLEGQQRYGKIGQVRGQETPKTF
jgi:cellulose synthase/poly-beta-1,6-N-acetylglucosamine synthase-like glycosyltransferase